MLNGLARAGRGTTRRARAGRVRTRPPAAHPVRETVGCPGQGYLIFSRPLSSWSPGRARPLTGQPEADSPPRAGLPGVLHSLLPLAEPAGLLLADAAGLGLIGKIVLATAFRSAQRALAGQPG